MGSAVFPDDDVSSGELLDLARERLEPWGKHDFVLDVEDEDVA